MFFHLLGSHFHSQVEKKIILINKIHKLDSCSIEAVILAYDPIY